MSFHSSLPLFFCLALRLIATHFCVSQAICEFLCSAAHPIPNFLRRPLRHDALELLSNFMPHFYSLWELYEFSKIFALKTFFEKDLRPFVHFHILIALPTQRLLRVGRALVLWHAEQLLSSAKLSYHGCMQQQSSLLGSYVDHADRQIFYNFQKHSFIKLANAGKTQWRQHDSNFLLQINSFQV